MPTPRTGPDPVSTNTHAYETPRLTIEVPDPWDAPRLYQLVGGPDREEICATLQWDGPDSLAEVERWIAACRTATFRDFGYHWVIRDAGPVTGTAGLVLGAIGTRPTDTSGRADVGYWLGRAYWGQGVMTEALTGLLDYGFSVLDYAKMEAEVFAGNERGRRLVEAVGMRHEGTIRQAKRKRGRWVDVALYGILFGEWRRPEG